MKRTITTILVVAIVVMILPIMSAAQTFTYPPTATPVVSTEPSICRPIAVGPMATGGANLNIQVDTGTFAAPMDIYLGISAPFLSPDIFLFDPGNALLSLSSLVKWRSAVTAVNESVLGDIPVLALPHGTFFLMLLVTPADSMESATLWVTSFSTPFPAGFAVISGSVSSSTVQDGLFNADVYVIGQEQSRVQTAVDGSFSLLLDTSQSGLVPSGSSNPIAGLSALVDPARYTLVVLSQDRSWGTVFTLRVQEGEHRNIGSLVAGHTGTISGRVTLENQSNHSGISVYIPGTSIVALTAQDGSFVIDHLPEGTYPFIRAEKAGYTASVLPEISVGAGNTTQLRQQFLFPATGAIGRILPIYVNDYFTSLSVDVAIQASDNAVLMMLSEDPAFVNAFWRPVQSSLTYTFTGEGQYTLYVKFADANGLESPPYGTDVSIYLRPVANAGPDQILSALQAVQLDGSQSTALGSNPAYAWSFVSVPTGSAVSDTDLSALNGVAPIFWPDVDGTYELKLVVSDQGLQSIPDSVRVTLQCGFSQVTGSISLSSGALPEGIRVELGQTPSGAPSVFRITYADAQGHFRFDNVAAGDYYLRAGDRVRTCFSGSPGTSDGLIATYTSSTEIRVVGSNIELPEIVLHPGSCSITLGDDHSGTYLIDHRGFDFENHTFTNDPLQADIFFQMLYPEACPSELIGDAEYRLSALGGIAIVNHTGSDIFTTFSGIRQVPASGFEDEIAGFTHGGLVFIVQTHQGNYVKGVVFAGPGYAPGDGSFCGATMVVQWQLQPDGASSFDY